MVGKGLSEVRLFFSDPYFFCGQGDYVKMKEFSGFLLIVIPTSTLAKLLITKHGILLVFGSAVAETVMALMVFVAVNLMTSR